MCLPFVAAAQTAEEAETAIGGFFQSYAVAGYAPHGNMKADSIRIDGEARRIDIFCNEPFSSQPFTPERLESVYKGIASRLPEPFAKHSLQLYSQKGVRSRRALSASRRCRVRLAVGSSRMKSL